MAGIGQLLKALAALLPWKVVVALGVAIAIVGAPLWLESIRDRQIRGAVRQMVRAEPEAREELVRRAFALCGERPRRLLALAETAIRYDQRALRDEALAKLEAAGGKADAARLKKALSPEKQRFRDPLEAAIRVESLLGSGLTVAAADALAAARAQFPEDPELAALDARVSAAPPPS